MAVAISPYFDKPYIAPRDNTGVQIIQEGLRDRYRKRQAEEAKKAAAAAKSDEEYNTLVGSFTKNGANVPPILVDEQNADTRNLVNKVYEEKKKATERGGIFNMTSDLAAEIAAHNTRTKEREAFGVKHRSDIEQHFVDSANDDYKVSKTPQGLLVDEFNASGTNPERRKQIQEELRGTGGYTLPFEYYSKEKSYGTIQSMMQEAAKKLDLKPTIPREVKDIKGNVRAIEMDYTPEDRKLLIEQTLKSHPKAPKALSEYIAELGMANASDDQPEKQQAVLDLTEPFLRPKVDASFKPQPSGDRTYNFGDIANGDYTNIGILKNQTVSTGKLGGTGQKSVAVLKSTLAPVTNRQVSTSNILVDTSDGKSAIKGKQAVSGVTVHPPELVPVYKKGAKGHPLVDGVADKRNLEDISGTRVPVEKLDSEKAFYTYELQSPINFKNDKGKDIQGFIPYDGNTASLFMAESRDDKPLIMQNNKIMKAERDKLNAELLKSGTPKGEPVKTYKNGQSFKSAADIDTKMLVEGNTYNVGGVKRIFKNKKLMLLPK